MADTTKRGSIASKSVATPKTSGDSLDSLSKLGKAIGARVKITTAAPHSQTYEGTLFTACPVLHIVAVNTRAASNDPATNAAAQPADYHVIPFTRIASFQVLSPQQGGDGSIANALPPIGPVDLKQLQKREEARIEQLKAQESDRGKGVTREAQAIYDAFKRINIPVRWHNQEIIVLEHVIISAPYRPEDCKAGRDKQDSLGRVRKILEDQKRKIKEREEKERQGGAATPVGQRKGG